MARFHWWGFIVNEAGEPIENAEVSVRLAGTETKAWVYFDEYGTDQTNGTELGENNTILEIPHFTTLSNGYYEFWIADNTEPNGYTPSQKFKISWKRVGVASGEIDYVNIFPMTHDIFPVDETDQYSNVKNKAVSDLLAYGWQQHSDYDITVRPFPIHGFMPIDTDQEGDTLVNKIVSNDLGWKWESHRNSTVQAPLEADDRMPHDIEEVDFLKTDDKKNKLVSNKLIYDMMRRSDDIETNTDDVDLILQNQIDNLESEINSFKSQLFVINPEQWLYIGLDQNFIYDIDHNMNIDTPFVICYDFSSGKVLNSADVTQINVNKTRITVYDNTIKIKVRIRN